MTTKEFEVQRALGTLSKARLISIAMSSNTSAEVLDKLSNDKNWVIRNGVAKNDNTSTDTLITLSKDEDWFVKRGAKRTLMGKGIKV